MKLLGGIAVLSCQNIEQTLAFYQRAFQFVILNRRDENGELAWVHLQSGDVALMLEKSTTSTPATGSVRLYYFVDNVADLHHYLLANQFQPGDLYETDYGSQEFDVTDPEGNRLSFGQKL